MTGLSHQPCATAAAAAATALDPEAEVSPAPRSHTETRRVCVSSTSTSWTFVRSGKRWMALEERPEPEEIAAVVLEPDHGVRVADGDRCHLERLAVDVEGLGPADLDRPELLLDEPVGADLRAHRARADVHLHVRLRRCAGRARRRRSACRCPTSPRGSRRGSRSAPSARRPSPRAPRGLRRSRLRRRQRAACSGVSGAACVSLLDEQVGVPERVPFAESHRRPLPRGDPR